MPKHKDLNLSTFLHAANPDLVERYLLRFFAKEKLPAYLMGMNPDYVLYVLDQSEEPLREAIIEDLSRINDICYKDIPLRAAQRFGVALKPHEKPQATALRLFLDHPRVFEFAWALYSYTSSYASISQHWLQRPHTQADSQAIADFKGELQSFFEGQARGRECRLQVYDEPDEMVILVLHGSPLRTVACWQGHEVIINEFRLACEDVLIYDKRQALLSIKVSTPKDREYYVRCFARLIMGDEALADHPERDLIYTLEPLQTGRFDWAGNGKVMAVEMVGGRIKPNKPGYPALVIEGDKRDWLTPSLGQLTEARLRFTIGENGKQEKITFNIVPPCITDLVKKSQADAISDYLRRTGVLLR